MAAPPESRRGYLKNHSSVRTGHDHVDAVGAGERTAAIRHAGEGSLNRVAGQRRCAEEEVEDEVRTKALRLCTPAYRVPAHSKCDTYLINARQTLRIFGVFRLFAARQKYFFSDDSQAGDAPTEPADGPEI